MATDIIVCQLCKKHPAEITILRRKNRLLSNIALCAKCSQDEFGLIPNTTININKIFTQIKQNSSTDPASSYSCALCGTTLAEIIAEGKPGCCNCYIRFADELSNVIESAQQRVFHTGKSHI